MSRSVQSSASSHAKNLWNAGLDKAAIDVLNRLDDLSADSAKSEIDDIVFPVWADTVHEIIKLDGHQCPCGWQKMSKEEMIASASSLLSFERFRFTIMEALNRVFEISK